MLTLTSPLRDDFRFLVAADGFLLKRLSSDRNMSAAYRMRLDNWEWRIVGRILTRNDHAVVSVSSVWIATEARRRKGLTLTERQNEQAQR